MTNLKESLDKNEINTCRYCGHHDPDYSNDDMIMHMARDCPLVISF